MNNLKEIIVERRKILRLTQKDLAAKLNVSDKVISKWETGASLPDLSLVNALSEALEISVSELLSAKELTKPVSNETTDDNLIYQYKFKFIVSVALMVFGLILIPIYMSFYTDDLAIILMILSIAFILLSLTIFISNIIKFRSTYTKMFYQKPYDQVFYRYNLAIIDVISLTIYLLPTVISNNLVSFSWLVILVVILVFLKLGLATKTNHKFKNKKHMVWTYAAYVMLVVFPILHILNLMQWFLLILTITVFAITTSISYYKLDYK